MNIENRNIIVTGGASGIGLAFALHLSQLGARVRVLDRDDEAIERAIATCCARPASSCRARPASTLEGTGDLTFRCCDVGVESDAAQAVREAKDQFGAIDVLINNAAVLRDQALVSKIGGKLRRHSLEDWSQTLQSNLTGAFLMAREAAAAMIEGKRGGLIVNISSISRNGNPGQSAYAASKAGIDALTKTWARELAPYRIRVVAIAPGFVETSMTERIPLMFRERLLERTPLKRFGSLREFALTIQFVIENDYLNGAVLEVDGGLRL